jgi:proteasome lid subunit RPN8/RPN11
MFSKVKLSKGALAHFRRKAREAYPLEIHAYLLGEITSIDTIKVEKFCYPKYYATQTPANVGWSAEEYAKLKVTAEEKGLKIVGDIHSHPRWDAVMSPDDYKSCLLDSLSVCGICSIYDKQTRVRFWTPTSSLPMEAHYT